MMKEFTDTETQAVERGCAECGKDLAGDEPINGVMATNKHSGEVLVFCSTDCADLHHPFRARLRPKRRS